METGTEHNGFRTLVEHLPVPVVVGEFEDLEDLGSFRFTYVNQAGCDQPVLVEGLQQNLNQRIAQALPEFHKSQHPFLYQHILKNQQAQELPQSRLEDNTGTRRLFDAQGFPLGNLRVAIIFHDVTDRQRHANQLEGLNLNLHSERRRLALALETSEMGIWERDLSSGNTTMDSRCAELLQVHPSDSLDQIFERVHPEDQEEFLAKVQRLVRAESQREHWLYRLKNTTGEYRWIESRAVTLKNKKGEIDRTMGVCWDVTERQRVREQNRRLLEIVEATPDFIGTTSLEGRVVWHNRAFSEWAQTPDVNEGNYTASDFYPEDVSTRLRTEIFPTVLKKGMWQGESIVQSQQGSTKPVSQIILLHRDTQGNPTYFSTVMRDLTELKLREEDLKQSNADLEQFAYVASHDLQEPLRMVRNYCELLASEYTGKLDKDADLFIHYAVDGARRMQQLIKDLLAFSRIDRTGGVMEEVSLESILENATFNLAASIKEKGATITHQELPTIYGDSSQLTQLFQNLIGNGMKFVRDKSPHIQVTAKESPRAWILSISDNGIGMDMKYASRIFDVFQRLHGKTEYEGTGIGLAICKRVVEHHRGEIWVESKLGEGSTFHFTVSKSLREDKPPSLSPPSSSATASPTAGPTAG